MVPVDFAAGFEAWRTGVPSEALYLAFLLAAGRQPRATGAHALQVIAKGAWELRISAWDGGEVVCPL